MPRTAHAHPRAALTLLLAVALLAPIAGHAGAATFPGDAIVGPSSALRTLDGIAVAPDGSGAIAFTLQDGGVEHVFVSRLVDGGWSAPERLDGGLAGASSQPTIAAGDGGRVLVAFTNGGNVYALTRPGASAAYGAPQTIWGGGGASGPALDLSANGKAYLVFAAPGAGGHDVRAAFSTNGGPWALAAAPLDASAGADAGVGTGRPQVGVSADGTAVAVWGEGGRVVARRVRGTQPSIVYADASGGTTVEGVPIASADAPVVGVQDDDSFAGVAFRGVFDVDGVARERVVYRRLRGSRFESPTTVDATPFASGQGSLAPRIATLGGGQGIVLGSSDTSFLSFAMLLGGDVAAGPIAQIDSVAQSTAATHAVPAVATPLKMLVAWQLTPSGGTPQIDARYYDGSAFEAEQALSRPALGPTDASAGLVAAGDRNGDLVVAYVQDVPGQGPAIAVATIDQPPGRFAAIRSASFQRNDRPVLSWTTSRESWGRYFRVTIDGVQAGLTGRLSFRPPAPLAQGAHGWQVTALDRRGQQYVAVAKTVRVDSVPAVVAARVSGRRRARAALRLAVHATDSPPPVAAGGGATPIQTSGVKAVLVDWGDGARVLIRRGARHVYAHSGRYRLRIVVTDGAGNRTTVRELLRIAKPPKAKHKHGK
jgi:hypothetical protein